MKTKLITSLFTLTALLHYSTTQAEEVRYDSFFSGDYAWELGTASGDAGFEPSISQKSDSIINAGLTYAYGNLRFEHAITLQNPTDSLEFYYTVNAHYSGGPYSSIGLGLLAIYGNTNIISGANGCENGEFSAITSTTSSSYYTFRSSGAYDVTKLDYKSAVTLKEVIGDQSASLIRGTISWDGEQFAVTFNANGRTTTPIQVAEKVVITGLGVTLDGSPLGEESLSNIVLIHRTGSIPEPSTGVLTLAGLGIAILRRRRRR